MEGARRTAAAEPETETTTRQQATALGRDTDVLNASTADRP
ncbi:hypothetical protein [Streptomyces sp. NPDC048481]